MLAFPELFFQYRRYHLRFGRETFPIIGMQERKQKRERESDCNC